jgi:hypothetical protein
MKNILNDLDEEQSQSNDNDLNKNIFKEEKTSEDAEKEK